MSTIKAYKGHKVLMFGGSDVEKHKQIILPPGWPDAHHCTLYPGDIATTVSPSRYSIF